MLSHLAEKGLTKACYVDSVECFFDAMVSLNRSERTYKNTNISVITSSLFIIDDTPERTDRLRMPVLYVPKSISINKRAGKNNRIFRICST